MQGLATGPGNETGLQRRLDQMGLVLLGDCRVANHPPRLLRQYVTDEILLVQPVHDQHDPSPPLVMIGIPRNEAGGPLRHSDAAFSPGDFSSTVVGWNKQKPKPQCRRVVFL